MDSLLPAYTEGTHRLIPPEQTLTNIEPHLMDIGITRCADVTGLDDDLGVPTYCAIRPGGLILQTSNGKGLTRTSAKVSALMEAIELYHAENPEPERLRRDSYNKMLQEGSEVVSPDQIGRYYNHYFSKDFKIDWVEGKNLLTGKKILVPASAVYFGCEPSLYNTSTNGLASGNHIVEATLHALYELIERDAISKISENGQLKIKEKCKIIDTATIENSILKTIINRIESARSKLILLWAESCVPIHTFWAVLLNQSPFSDRSTVNVGFGTHFDLSVAAARAITEAVQSRLSMIQGSREDIINKPVLREENVRSSPAFKYMDSLGNNTDWQELEPKPTFKSNDLLENHDYLLKEMADAGHDQIMRFDLTKPKFKIPVVKVLVPSLQFNLKLF